MPDDKSKQQRRARGTGSVFQKVKGGRWHIQYYIPNPDTGRRDCKKEYVNAATKADAERKLRDRLAKIDRGEQFEVGKPRTVAELYKALYTATLTHARPGSRKAEGLKWHWAHLQPFFGAMRATAVTTTRIDEYKLQRRAEGAKNATINRELASIRRMFNYGKNECNPPLVHNVPHIAMFDERDNVRKGFVEYDAFSRMADEAAKEGLWMRALIEVAYTCGWRRGELINLRVRQIDLRARTIRLDTGTTKNGDGRQVWMDDAVYALIKELVAGKQGDAYVFTRADGQPVRDFRGAWQNLCIRACVPGPDGKPSRFECGNCNEPMKAGTSICRACGGRRRYVGLIVHDMRRSAARNLLHAGVPETDVMNTLGHKTRSMVTRYAIFDPNASKRAMEKLAQYERAMKALAEAERQINPQVDPSGVETGQTAKREETTRIQ